MSCFCLNIFLTSVQHLFIRQNWTLTETDKSVVVFKDVDLFADLSVGLLSRGEHNRKRKSRLMLGLACTV